MKFYCHVPKLLDFALYAACDDIVKHGKQGLKVAMPRPLYYRCIMTFAEKYGRVLTTKKSYDAIRCGRELCYYHHSDITITLHCTICLIYHICLDDVNIFAECCSLFFALTVNADEDVDSVVQCIHRFGTMCDDHGKHQLMMDVMTHTLNRPYQLPCKAIRDVMSKYGAVLERDGEFLERACSYGMLDLVKSAAEHGQVLKIEHIINSLDSGDIETVKYVMACTGVSSCKISSLNATDFSVNYCVQLRDLGIIERGIHYGVQHITSIHVLQWLLDNDNLAESKAVCEMARNAATKGGVYVDMLHYMIEQRHLPMPKDVFAYMNTTPEYDLSVFNYLMSRGGDMNVMLRIGQFENQDDALIFGPLSVLPLYLRYWLDSGMIHERLNWAVLQSCVGCLNQLPPQVLDACVMMLNGNINIVHPNGAVGVSLLHCAACFEADRHEYIDENDSRMLVLKYMCEHGANINARDASGRTPLHTACRFSDSGAVSMLLDHGASINARDGNGKTPLFSFIDNEYGSHDTEIVDVLLEHGANVHVPDDTGRTPLHAACTRANDDGDMVHVVKMLLQYGATSDVYVQDDDDHVPYECTNNAQVGRLLMKFGYKVGRRV